MTINLSEHKVCSCGSCQEALDEAMATFQTTVNTRCLTWFAGHVVALNAILATLMAAEEEAVGSSPIERRANRVLPIFAQADEEVFDRVIAILEAKAHRSAVN